MWRANQKCKGSCEAYFLACRLLDRLLSTSTWNKWRELDHVPTISRPRVLATVCLHIACKFDAGENGHPWAQDWSKVSDRLVTSGGIAALELQILSTLEFQLAVPTVWDYASLLFAVCAHTYGSQRRALLVAVLLTRIPGHASSEAQAAVVLHSHIARRGYDTHHTDIAGFSELEQIHPTRRLLYWKTRLAQWDHPSRREWCTRHIAVAPPNHTDALWRAVRALVRTRDGQDLCGAFGVDPWWFQARW